MLTAIIRSCTGGEARIQRQIVTFLLSLIFNILRIYTLVINLLWCPKFVRE